MRHKYDTPSSWYAVVAEYAHIPVTDVPDLPLTDYLLLRRDAVIAQLSRTESGVEYLNDAWAREQTDPDLDALWDLFGGGTHGTP